MTDTHALCISLWKDYLSGKVTLDEYKEQLKHLEESAPQVQDDRVAEFDKKMDNIIKPVKTVSDRKDMKYVEPKSDWRDK